LKRNGVLQLDFALRILGFLLIPMVWIVVKNLFQIPDRFLPGPIDVVYAARDLDPNVGQHFAASAVRLLVGFTLGVVIGLVVAAIFSLFGRIRLVLDPVFSSLQSVPPLATVPFFILWFGFSELGKFLIVFLAVATNIVLYGVRTLDQIDSKYVIMIKSYKLDSSKTLFKVYLPYIISRSLPTVRYMLSVSIGLVLFSELLGAQLGLGYLIQTARSTFSMALVFLAALLATALYVTVDYLLVVLWRTAFRWSLR
jgi:ABC-type nitrate/sulfonate/bicarbonate transport system permease component